MFSRKQQTTNVKEKIFLQNNQIMKKKYLSVEIEFWNKNNFEQMFVILNRMFVILKKMFAILNQMFVILNKMFVILN